MKRAETLPRVAGMATMPSRAATAAEALATILPQVDVLWLFLDRFDAVPPYARDRRIRVVRSQDVGDLRANGKLLGVALNEQPCIFFSVDDDIAYPPDYCDTLVKHLDRYDQPVVVGVHAALFPDDLRSYTRDTKVLHRRSPQERARCVDLLGTDSIAFRTTTLHFDVRAWTNVNMVDLSFARLASERSIPLVMIPRGAHWLRALDENQQDSIWRSALQDDSRQSVLARELIAMRKARATRHPCSFVQWGSGTDPRRRKIVVFPLAVAARVRRALRRRLAPRSGSIGLPAERE